MPATRPTTIQQRQAIMDLARTGLSYRQIAQRLGLSHWTVRKWARRSRSGAVGTLVSGMGRPANGPLAGFPPLVRYLALRWEKQHPHWGADYIVHHMRNHPPLRGQPLPHPVSLWRYWRTFAPRLATARRRPAAPPPPAGTVHGLWQLDFKESVVVSGVGPTTITQARDSIGRATVLHRVHTARAPQQRIVKLTSADVQVDCRLAFATWGLPDAIQTDRASLFHDDDPTPFPTRLGLWWCGLGIVHYMIPPHRPQRNGSVERSHRTLAERTLTDQTFRDADHMQTQIDHDWHELNAHCGSRARGCHGLPPLRAHPDLLIPRRPYAPEHELELFDLRRVDAQLAESTWVRTVNSHGRLSLGGSRYGLGRAWAGFKVSIRFDSPTRHFVFTPLPPTRSAQPAALTPLTRPAQGLSAADLCGPISGSASPARQLAFPADWFAQLTPSAGARLSATSVGGTI